MLAFYSVEKANTLGEMAGPHLANCTSKETSVTESRLAITGQSIGKALAAKARNRPIANNITSSYFTYVVRARWNRRDREKEGYILWMEKVVFKVDYAALDKSEVDLCIHV